MARRGVEKQLSLPFQADRVGEIFVQFRPEVEKCHRLQDAPGSTSGNEFWWWRSRFSEFLQSNRADWGFERYSEAGKLFPSIWQQYEQSFTRHTPTGVPRAALEI